MRIPGIGGEVMARLGAVPLALPGSEIYAALERGVIDAAEWVGPYDDEKLGLYKIAKHYYYPAFWEGGTELCVMINAAAWDKLPKIYQEVVESAAAEAHVKTQAQYDAKNPIALKSLIANGVKLHPFPRDLLRAANKAPSSSTRWRQRRTPDSRSSTSRGKSSASSSTNGSPSRSSPSSR